MVISLGCVWHLSWLLICGPSVLSWCIISVGYHQYRWVIIFELECVHFSDRSQFCWTIDKCLECPPWLPQHGFSICWWLFLLVGAIDIWWGKLLFCMFICDEDFNFHWYFTSICSIVIRILAVRGIGALLHELSQAQSYADFWWDWAQYNGNPWHRRWQYSCCTYGMWWESIQMVCEELSLHLHHGHEDHMGLVIVEGLCWCVHRVWILAVLFAWLILCLWIVDSCGHVTWCWISLWTIWNGLRSVPSTLKSTLCLLPCTMLIWQITHGEIIELC